MDDIEQAMMGGINFKAGKDETVESDRPGKVKTKAKKATYITGLHKSDSAKMKADIRKKRAARKSQQRGKNSR